MRRLSFLGAFFLIGCVGDAHRPGASPAAATDAATSTRPPVTTLPTGTVAERRGAYGTVRVEERDGLRLLTIDGEVQGAQPLDGSSGTDPLAPLLRAMRSGKRGVLLLGLGTGKTAADLRAAGFDVTVVERDANVVDLARAHFGYRGAVVTQEAASYLRNGKARYDAIIVDGWVPDGGQPMLSVHPADQDTPSLTASEQSRQTLGRALLAHLGDRLTEAGVVVLRSFDTPSSKNLRTLAARIEGALSSRFQDLYGDGIADEPQNVVLVSSRKPMNVVAIEGCPLWHVERRMLRKPKAASAQDAESNTMRRARRASQPAATARPVVLSGYVIRLDGGELALDLPHWEMGAVRYLLTGDAVKALASRLGEGARFPTDGDIASDGDTSQTLRDALGGGGAKRSDVRFSRLAAQLVGEAKLVSVVHPDAAARVPESMRGDARTDPRLPYGGALYVLDVSEVRWAVEHDRWQQLVQASQKDMNKAWARVRSGALDEAAALVAARATALASLFPGARVSLAERLSNLAEALTLSEEEKALGHKVTSDMVIGVRCDRGASVFGLDRDDPLYARLADELDVCRRTRYRAVLAKGPDHAKELIAGRLMRLYAAGWAFDKAGRLDSEKKIESLRAQYPIARTQPEPPALGALAE